MDKTSLVGQCVLTIKVGCPVNIIREGGSYKAHQQYCMQ